MSKGTRTPKTRAYIIIPIIQPFHDRFSISHSLIHVYAYLYIRVGSAPNRGRYTVARLIIPRVLRILSYTHTRTHKGFYGPFFSSFFSVFLSGRNFVVSFVFFFWRLRLEHIIYLYGKYYSSPRGSAVPRRNGITVRTQHYNNINARGSIIFSRMRTALQQHDRRLPMPA